MTASGHPAPDRADFDDYWESYEHALQQGLAVSGESRVFFARARVDHVRRMLGAKPVRRVLDYGCGDGETSVLLATVFPEADVVGSDVSSRSVDRARSLHSSRTIGFLTAAELAGLSGWQADLVYTNGVFHHIPPVERGVAIGQITRMLAPDGCLAFWENNPWNPGTRLVMRRISFDRNAITLSPPTTRRLMRESGLRIERMDFLFYFPRPLAFLRWTERFLRRLPLGAQYCAFCVREA